MALSAQLAAAAGGKLSPSTTPRPPRISSPYNIEDATIEIALLSLWSQYQKDPSHHGAHILIPAEAGDTAIALAIHPLSNHVDAVDPNLAQIHVSRLKRVAYNHFTSVPDYFLFFSNPHNEAAVDEKTQEFRTTHLNSILNKLSSSSNSSSSSSSSSGATGVDATVAYWGPSGPVRKDFVVNGLYSFGHRQQVAAALTRKLNESGLNPFLGENGLTEDQKAKWTSIWTETISSPFSSTSTSSTSASSSSAATSTSSSGIPLPLSPASAALASHPEDTSSPPLGTRFAENVWNAIHSNTHHGRDNWVIRSWFGANGTTKSELPHHLQVHDQRIISNVNLDQKITFLHKDITQQLIDNMLNKSYDIVSCGNILDNINSDFRDRLLTAVADALASEGLVLFRTGPYPCDLGHHSGLRKLVGKYLSVDEELSDQFASNELTLHYTDVVVARKAGLAEYEQAVAESTNFDPRSPGYARTPLAHEHSRLGVLALGSSAAELGDKDWKRRDTNDSESGQR